ncbi:MAG TPA: hypothetical protein VMD91_18585 [Candidatus Sulfotelmatobacter sp.]|nr:hypothetical protein [Candidatus Sulfotelmatobacter sp.]
MLQRSTLAFGTASIAAALLLAACGGGGGGGATRPSVPAVTPTGAPSSAPSSKTTKLTFTIDRKPSSSLGAPWPVKTSASGRRAPKYLAPNVDGVEVAITAGGSSQTLYVDVANVPNNVVCPGPGTASNNYQQTCTVPIPILGTGETVTVTELDQEPLDETNGYGTGFATKANILAVGSGSVTPASSGTTGVTLVGLSPVIGGFSPLNFYSQASTIAQDYPTTRIVAVAGTPVLALGAMLWLNQDGSAGDGDKVPLSFVDVNGAAVAPTIQTFVGSSTPTQHVLVYPYRNAGFANDQNVYLNSSGIVPPPSGGLAQTVSMPTDDYAWGYFFFPESTFIYAISYDGSVPPASTPYYTIQASNNLTASPSSVGFPASNGGNPYTDSEPFVLAVLSQSLASTSLAVGTPASASLTDYGSTSGGEASPCLDANGNGGYAVIVPSGTIDATTGVQAFSVIPVGAGSCSFSLGDADTDLMLPATTLTIAAQPASAIAAAPSALALEFGSAAATVAASESSNPSASFSAALTCQPNPSGQPSTDVADITAQTSSTFTVAPGTASGTCALTISDGGANTLVVPVTVSTLDATISAKHRK